MCTALASYQNENNKFSLRPLGKYTNTCNFKFEKKVDTLGMSNPVDYLIYLTIYLHIYFHLYVNR